MDLEYTIPNPTRLPKGKCMDLFLVKLNVTITIKEPPKEAQQVLYELDLRELKKEETFREDPKSRDFKMNSVYYSVVGQQVVDITQVAASEQGCADIRNGAISCVNNFAETFDEDNTRFVRAIRFKVAKSLKLSPELDEYIKSKGFECVVVSCEKSKRTNIGFEYDKFFKDDELFVRGFPELLSYGLIYDQKKPTDKEYQGSFKKTCKLSSPS